ncbi:MAG: helical backbone metal receptor [bacterium]
MNCPQTPPRRGVSALAWLTRGRICVGACLIVFLSGCARPAAQPDGLGLRLVSTAPNLTECVCAIGAGDLLVGRTEACDYPAEAMSHIPITGGFGTPYMEPLLATRPTHVLETVLAEPDVSRRLQALHIPVVHVPCTRLAEIPDALCQLGVLTGHTAEAQRLADTLRAGINNAHAESAARTQRPNVFLLFAPDSPITAGRNAYISELLELAGGVNIGNLSPIDYYHVSLEWLMTQNPDMILCLFETPVREPCTLFENQVGWNALDAVRQRRVYTVADLSTVSRPGPRVLEGLAQLKEVLRLDSSRLKTARVDPSRSEPQ